MQAMQVVGLWLLCLAILEQFWAALVRSLQQVTYHVELLFFGQYYYIRHLLWLLQQTVKVRGWCSSLKCLGFFLFDSWWCPIANLNALRWSKGWSRQETALGLRCDAIIDLFLLKWYVFCSFIVTVTNLATIVRLIQLLSGSSLGLFCSILVSYLVHLLLLLLNIVQTAQLDDAVLLHLEKLYCVLELIWGKFQVLNSLIKKAQSLITACQVVVKAHYQIWLTCLLLKLILCERCLNESWAYWSLNQGALNWTD